MEIPIFERKKQSGIPSIDPKVPGAKEMFPIKQPVARNMTNFCLKFMACLYSLAIFLSRNSIESKILTYLFRRSFRLKIISCNILIEYNRWS